MPQRLTASPSPTTRGSTGRWRARRLVQLTLASLALCGAGMSAGETPIAHHWRGDFQTSEQAQLVAWIAQVTGAVERITGPLPFELNVAFHRRAPGRGAVGWANTERADYQGVNLHVDPSHSMAAFIADWTAPHEISHLLIPYVGRRNAWFAEGFASYMQYQVMIELGAINHTEAYRRYDERMARAQRRYRDARRALPDAAGDLVRARDYPTMYWGGAVLFLRIDARLRAESKQSLAQVLGNYLDCCRMQNSDLRQVIRGLDLASDTKIVSEEYRRFRQERGFPDYRQDLQQLARLWDVELAVPRQGQQISRKSTPR